MQEIRGSFDPCMAMYRPTFGPVNSEPVVSAVAEKVVVANVSTPASSVYRYDFGPNSCSPTVVTAAQ